jgi:hypothetical protein
LADRLPTLIEEATAAARGVGALIMGDRQAGRFFDFSLRGLVGSFIAFLVITLVNGILPMLMGIEAASGSIGRSLLITAILFALQIAFSAIVLRQMKRMDGFLPFLVADNWATFFITTGATVLAVFGFTGDLSLIAVAILVLVVEINIARLIIGLSPLQIAMFLIAQLVGVSVGLLLVGGLLPVPPGAELQAVSG